MSSVTGDTGFVSFECTPDLADDAEATVRQALEVSDRLDVPNLLIKVAATDAGIKAIEELTARGVSVNVTLLFSVERYAQAIGAYWDGLTRRAGAGDRLPVSPRWLRSSSPGSTRRSTPGSRRTHPCSDESRSPTPSSPTPAIWGHLKTPRWKALAAQGARPQRPLWASTATKNPDYSDRSLRRGAGRPRSDQHDAPGDVSMPSQIMETSARLSAPTPARPSGSWQELARTDVKFAALTDALEREGVESFRESYRQVLSSIEAMVARLAAEVADSARV